jgi:hypothetical protein
VANANSHGQQPLRLAQAASTRQPQAKAAERATPWLSGLPAPGSHHAVFTPAGFPRVASILASADMKKALIRARLLVGAACLFAVWQQAACVIPPGYNGLASTIQGAHDA